MFTTPHFILMLLALLITVHTTVLSVIHSTASPPPPPTPPYERHSHKLHSPPFFHFRRSAAAAAAADSPSFLLPNPPIPVSYVYYVDSCPRAYDIVREHVQLFVRRDASNAAALLHLFFSDCFLQGCDASSLLSATRAEKQSVGAAERLMRSRRSTAAMKMVDEIKASLEAKCPGIVSCADALALAARDAIFMVGGPWIPIITGRKDRRSRSSSGRSSSYISHHLTSATIPLPTQGFSELKSVFQSRGLNVQDLVALSGAHTIGQTHCRIVAQAQRQLLAAPPDLSPLFAANLSRICLRRSSRHSMILNGHMTVHLDGATPDLFDNSYFKNVLAKQAIFHSDAALLEDPQALAYVRLFASNQTLFFRHFRLAFSKMSLLGVLTSSHDEEAAGGGIRTRCTASF